MANRFSELSDTETWQILVTAAKKGAEAEGYTLSRKPGRGRSNTWVVEQNGQEQTASIRTSKNRWIAFPPLRGGTRWKTLDDVEVVFVAVVDSRENPQNVEVYRFPADEVRRHFDAAYAARKKAGRKVKDNFGMWINLDADSRGVTNSVGSGLAAKHEPISVYPLSELMAAPGSLDEEPDEEDVAATTTEEVVPARRPATIAEVINGARKRVAEIAGVRVEAVKLDLKIEY